ncbi:MAG: response regulator [Bacteroidetes bacterium]|nr:response regulator [Bacteroidota bacterium]
MKKVLIIEDEQDIVDIATMILEDEGYEVASHCAFNGFEKKVNDADADVVLLDLNLDGYHGKDICKYIKNNDQLKGTSVILMSANLDIEAIKEEAGADGYITKPFDLADFINIVKAFINKRKLAVQTS